jgi:tetratricopeptide (TPR) repeat protein
MSEHELWNELGNLYFLSGFKKQAVHAYKKAIQIENDFGKPYSNLALIYMKQAKYEDAIKLYKKSLALLKDDVEKAITWNRLGNVYRQLKDYQEAVYAYHCANELMFKNDEIHELSDQMLYISSESEALSYEVIEDHHDIHNHHASFTLDVEPEFDESLPELALVEADVLVDKTFYNQNTDKDLTGEVIVAPNPSPSVEIVEMPGPAVQRSRPLEPSKETTSEEIPHIASEVETLNGSEVNNLHEEPLNKGSDFEPNNSAQLDNSPENEDAEAVVNESELITSETNTNLDEEALSAGIELAEPIAQAEGDAGALPVGFSQTTPEESTSSSIDGLETDAEFVEIVTQATEDVDSLTDESAPILPEADISPEESEPEIYSVLTEPTTQAEEDINALPDELLQTFQETKLPVDRVPSTDPESVSSITPIGDGTDINGEPNSDLVIGNPPRDIVQDAEGEDAQGADKEIAVEEEKLTQQIEINPRSATTWEALGTLYKTAGRYEEAIQAFKQAIAIAPREVSYYHNLGLVYAAQGNNTDAFNTFQKVLELNPNHSLTHASLGGYYKKMGLEELAEKHIGKAMKQIYASENEYNRACLEAICGNIEQAIELLRIALEKKQTYVDWILHDPDLDPLHEDEHFKQLIADFSQ